MAFKENRLSLGRRDEGRMRCQICDTEIQSPAFASVSKGVAGMPMNDGNRGYLIRDDKAEEIACCSYTVWDCHECGRRRALKKLQDLGGQSIALVRFERVDGIGRVYEIIKDLTPGDAA
jgi:hypothetical protein